MLKNYMEELVDIYLPRVLHENAGKYMGLCQCPDCISEIKAAALNEVKPFYITCKVGEVFGEYRFKELQQRADLLAAVTRAIEDVRVRADKIHAAVHLSTEETQAEGEES